MLEAVPTDLVSTISLKRSTQNFSFPQARRPITPTSRRGAAGTQRRSLLTRDEARRIAANVAKLGGAADLISAVRGVLWKPISSRTSESSRCEGEMEWRAALKRQMLWQRIELMTVAFTERSANAMEKDVAHIG